MKKQKAMTKKERIAAAIRGDAVDTVPYSLWTHLPGIDLDAEKNAEATYDFFRKYDVDILKTMNNGMYSVDDFGAVCDYSDIEKGGVAKIVSTPVHEPGDWLKLEPASVHAGALARELTYLRLLVEKTKGAVPVVFTIFSPLTTATKLCGDLQKHVQEGHGDKVKQALSVITETTSLLVRQVIESGADGIFLAAQQASYALSDENFYREYGMPYDLAVLAASRGWCNVLHAHGTDIMFPLLRKYPVHIFNWHARESLPTMAEAKVLTGKCLMAGLVRGDITAGRKNEIERDIFETLRDTGGRGLILSPGCVIRYPLDEGMLKFVRTAKQEIESRFDF